jgi:MOSC domain-containing protein YiiM
MLGRVLVHYALAGDQLFVDLDLSSANLPPGSLLTAGSAVLQVTAIPDRGCKKFVDRFGLDAMRFVNSPIGRELNLRGVNARVIQSGLARSSDAIRKA